MTTIVQYQPDLKKAYGNLHHHESVPADVHVLCLWSAFGLAVTGLLFAMGFGAEIGLALMAAG
jgi:hypothetical protein